ncbi:biotin transporter BioY [Anaerotignum faecicola]|nr:biotin transporter BioY [Anaerotignum faecicola]
MTTRDYLICGIFAAVLGVSSILVIPMFFTPIPITFQVMALGITAAVLGGRKGTLSVLIYVLLGAVGLPVFSGMKGGVGSILGPTGGYIWGFIPFAFISGSLIEFIEKNNKGNKGKIMLEFLSLLLGLAAVYVCGTIQFMAVAGVGLAEAVASAVAPFVVLDSLKLFGAVVISMYIKNSLPWVAERNKQ